MFQVPEKSHLFHLFYGPPIVRFTFITVHNISVYGIYRASWGLGGEDGLRQESREKCTSRSRQGLCMPSDHLVQVPESQKAL